MADEFNKILSLPSKIHLKPINGKLQYNNNPQT